MKKFLLILLLLPTLLWAQEADQLKYEKALQTLKADPSNRTARNSLEILVQKDEFNTEDAHFAIVNSYLERMGPTHYINSHIERLIQLDPNNNDYRFIRVRCNMLSSSGLDNLKKAIDDMNFMIDNGANTATVNTKLGIAYAEFARLLPKPIKPDTFKDENPEYDKKLKDYYDMVIENYSNAVESYKKAIEIDSKLNDKLKFEIKKVETSISELKAESSQ